MDEYGNLDPWWMVVLAKVVWGTIAVVGLYLYFNIGGTW